ncbi:MAG TPA: Na/Pi symporter [Stellaceae bacterium]|nr:Na/Pi symporter [Stellaceae bacterium]
MLLNSLISLFGGLGLFFVGVKLLSAEMAQLTGRQARHWLARSTGSYTHAALIGLVAGMMTQSTNAITVILMSLISADLIAPRRARPILAWANIGAAGLVLIAAVNLHLFVLALIGAIGLCFYFNLDRSKRWRPAVSALLGLGLILLGLEIMRGGAHQLQAQPAVVDFLQVATTSLITAFLAGAILTLLTQSAATVSVLAITMGAAGLLPFEHAVPLIYGANIGSGLGTYMVTVRAGGMARQLGMFPAVIKTTGVLPLLPLFVIEQSTGLPLLVALIKWLTLSPGLRIGLVYLACQITAVTVTTVFRRPIQSLLERWAPPSHAESLSRPRYLYDQALAEPETALMLVEREQARIFAVLPLHLGLTEALEGESVPLDAGVATPVATALLNAVDHFLANLADTGASRLTLERIAERQASNSMLQTLHEAMAEFVGKCTEPAETPTMQALALNLSEGLGALLLIAEEGVRTGAAEEFNLLHQLTDERDSMVDNLRRRVIATDQGLPARDQQLLYGLTNLFERIVWMLRRFVTSADQARRRAAAAA